MTKRPRTISRRATLAEAHALMRTHGIRHLPVVDGGNLVGIVSLGDLHAVELAADAPLDGVEVGQAMSEHPTVVTSDAPIDEVTEIMAEHKYNSVIVMGHGGIEGIFTTIDVCRALVDIMRKIREDDARA